MNLREIHMKYGVFFVFIRHDSAEIWEFRHGLTLGIGTQKIMASTGVFMRIIYDLKRSISSNARTSSLMLT
jgi:ABC-type sulfate/molybdate transport systems ATPase subunit